MKYNCQKHLELLKYKHELMQKGKFLSREDYQQLLHYSGWILEHLHWSNRSNYKKLMNDFLDAKICGRQFDEKFTQMFTKIEDHPLVESYEGIKNLKLSPNSLGFEDLVYHIYVCCEEFFDEYDPKEEFDPVLRTEEQLREDVKNVLPKMQKYV